VTALGQPAGGTAASATIVLVAGAPTIIRLPAGTKTIAVEGTTNDSTASVTVNGIPAVITGNTFRADGIALVEGPNTITATATDAAGNASSVSITVTLDTRPPARPTVASTPAVTTAASAALSGTKTPGTSLWINGVQIVPLGEATTWTLTVSLVEGDNVFIIVARDAAGNESTINTVNIVVDNLPPVITVTAPSKTNFNPFVFTGTVDDSLTTVVVNGVTASRSGRNFEAPLPLGLGVNPVTVTATSPRNLVSSASRTITLGRIPTISTSQPADGTTLYVGSAVTIAASATDPEDDPMEYQILLNGQVLSDWATASSSTWTPTEVQQGLRRLELRVRDAFGGFASRQAEVYVLRKPVSPP